MKRILQLALFLLIAPISVNSQSLLDWTAYTSFRSVKGVVEDANGRIWIGSDGGIEVREGANNVQTLTTIDGLSRLDVQAIIYSDDYEKIFVGYLTGDIDVINTDDYSVITLSDIRRNSSFSQKGINSFFINSNSLFVASDFGIIEYDLENLFVKDSYLKLGDFSTGNSVYDITEENGVLYVGTEEGIAYSNLDGDYGSDDWNNYDATDGFSSSATLNLKYFDNILYASTSDENYKFENSSWSINNDFQSNIILDYEIQGSTFLALSDKIIYFKSTGSVFESISLDSKFGTRIGKSPNSIFVGTRNNSIGSLDLTTNQLEFEEINSPFLNFFDGLNFDNGILFSGSTQKSSRQESVDKARGFYVFKDGTWENYNEIITPELQNNVFRQPFRTTSTDDFYYFGSWGTGVVRFEKETKEIFIFDENNSSLRGWPLDNVNYPVISGLQTDSNSDVWLVSRFGATPLYRQTPTDEDWQSFDEHNATNSSDLYEGLFIDSFDQKWIPLQNAQSSGTGLLIIDTKNPTNENDDLGVKLQTGSNNGNLPDNKVNAIIEDKNGEVWIGTARGIAKFIFPELIVEGSVQERTAQWLINEDTSAVSRFLLRDINVSAMAVNEANEKWIGSTNQGIWVLNAEGTRIIKRFTSENSPLFSDNIESIAINDLTGEVFISTDIGLISYQDVPKKAVRKMDNLKVFPNPFNYSKHEEIFIEGLSEESTVKVLGVDGTVVNSFESVGGRISWDARDSNNNELGSGVYFVVAVDSDGNSKGVGKVIIVR